MHRIDTRSMPCPKPVLMTRSALEEHGLPIEILVDAGIPLLNVRRFLESRGLAVSVSEDGSVATLTCSGSTAPDLETPPEIPAEEKGLEDIAILICSDTLGRSDSKLGEVLMKGFIGALAEREPVPAAIALMNEGVRLALPGSSASESLKVLEGKGSRILVCGTCVNHFGVKDSVCVGTVSNMFEISEMVINHRKNIVLS